MDGRKLLFMILPFCIFVFLFSYVPLFGWSYSLFNYKPAIPLSKTPFVGLQKFAEIFEERDEFLNVMKNTLALSFLQLLTTPVPVVFAILLAEVRNIPFKKLIQTTTTLPNFISWVIVFSLAFNLFSSEGLVNQILGWFSKDARQNLIGDPDAVWVFQTLLRLWKSLGWNAIIYLAAIAGIDQELYDAAKVDGAGRFRRILHITLPGVSSTYIVLLLLAISGLLNAGSGMDQYLVFSNPVVSERIEVLDLYVYKMGLVANDYSYATAVGIFKSLVSISLLFSVNFAAKKIRGQGIF
jgi:putative aldouronate transport system permease protein